MDAQTDDQLDPVMRVLHVIDRLGTSGTETSLRELLPALQGGGLNHAVATFMPGDQPPPSFVAAGIPVITPPAMLNSRLSRVRHIHHAVHRIRPHLLHTALFEADLAGRLAGLLTRTAVLSSLVNTPYVPAARPSGRLSQIKFGGAKAVDGFMGRRFTYAFHAVTQAVADNAVAELGLEPARIWVVPRGRSLDRLGEPSVERRKATRADLGIDASAPVLLNVGRHEPQKGQADLIASMSSIRQSHPDVRLLIAGREGRSTPTLQRRVADCGLHGVVQFLGARDDIGDLLAAADVFVFPSQYEGIGGAMLEAMIMGVPVVVSDLPGLREVLDDGRCGTVVPVGDPASLASAVCRILTDRAPAQERAAVARVRALDVYSFEASVEGMRSLYTDISAELDVPARPA